MDDKKFFGTIKMKNGRYNEKMADISAAKSSQAQLAGSKPSSKSRIRAWHQQQKSSQAQLGMIKASSSIP
jgi:hypothetical protein